MQHILFVNRFWKQDIQLSLSSGLSYQLLIVFLNGNLELYLRYNNTEDKTQSHLKCILV